MLMHEKTCVMPILFDLPHRCKSRLISQGSRSIFIYLDPVAYSIKITDSISGDERT